MTEKAVCLNIRLMGTAEAAVGEKPFVLNHLKSRALLFYLAATGQPHSRDHLATLLWGESGQREASHSLRSSLYHLRKTLHLHRLDEALVSQGERVSLHPAWFECDMLEFYRLVAQGDEAALSQAVGLWKGPLFQGFTVNNAPLYEGWVQAENTRLAQMCFDALDRLTALAEGREAWTVALEYARQMTQIDPLAETAQQRLMRLYLRQGEAGLALRQYLQFEAQLQGELGIRPCAETWSLHADILRQQPLPANRSAFPASFALRPSPGLPFVGREALLQELFKISSEVKAGRGATLLIQGEGGMGKSRLLEEFASRLIAASAPWMILQGACSPFDDLLSYGPFIEALQNATPEGVSEDLLADSATSVPDARGRFFWRVLQTLRSMAYSAPLMLFIDDLQWANSSTLNLFAFLSMRLRHLPVLLVGTVQHAEAIPALQRLVALGRRRHELHLFSLAPLSHKAISALLGAAGVDSPSVETFSDWLAAKSAGNPFLLSEILAQLRAEAILKRAGEGWQLDTTRWLKWRATFLLPETTHDLVSWRLADLSPEAHGVLDVLAVASQPVAIQVLHAIPGLWRETFPALIDDLLARGLILELPAGGTSGAACITLSHHLLVETLLHRLSNLRRRVLHRQLAEAMEGHGAAENEAALRQLALHAVAGEDVARARRYGMRLLAGPPDRHTGAEMVDFAHQLHDLLASSASSEEMVALTRTLGVLHQSLGQLEMARYWHSQWLDWARKGADNAAQAEAYFGMSELALVSHHYRTALQAAREGLARLGPPDSPSPRLFLLTGKGHRLVGAALAMEGRDLTAAEEHLHTAATLHRRIENQDDLCAVLFELGNVAAQRGELQRCLDLYEEAGRVAEAGRMYYYLALARNNFAYHSLLLGRVEEAQRAVIQGIKIADAYDLLGALLHLYSTRGEIYLHLGEWHKAEELFSSGLALAEELGSLERQAGYRGGLALAARGQKDFVRAEHLLEEALALIDEEGYWHLRTRLQLWLADTWCDQGRDEAATKLLDEALQVARSRQWALLVEQGEHLRHQLLLKRENEPLQ